MCDGELATAFSWTQDAASEGAIVVLAGDFNVTPERSRVLGGLGPAFSSPFAESIDQIIVRGAAVSSARVWPPEERRYGTRLLSDHAPVELVVA